MRISKIHIAENETKSVNLKEIDLTHKSLGSVVALVGKNGAGKSRILKFVEAYAKVITPRKYYGGHIANIPSCMTSPFSDVLLSGEHNYKVYIKNGMKKDEIDAHLRSSLASFSQRYQQLSPAYIKVVDNDDLKVIKNKLDNSITFETIISNDFQNIVKNSTALKQELSKPQDSKILVNEFTAFNNHSTVEYIKNLTNKIATVEFNLYLKNRDNPLVIKELIKEDKSFRLFNSFQNYVQKFLGKNFSYVQSAQGDTVTSSLHLNGEPFNIDFLSPGQKMLFAHAILFFYLDANSKTSFKESIIIIDEPEKHLHPEAQIQLIDALRDIIGKKGQLWIATHSVHILSHLDVEEILMVKDDNIILPSRTTPGNSFNELMGLENHIIELTNFISSISEWAYGNFMLQCFKNPDVIFDNNRNDPQFILFKEFIKEMSKLSLLDFGAGKGRIGYTISDDQEVASRVVYSAFEPDKGNYEFLSSTPNLYKLYSQIDEIPKGSFDIVILCNVLHEINPKDWVDNLHNIRELLKDEGYLIVIEDRFLPKGETAHEFGYIILGTEELPILLNSNCYLDLKLSEEKFCDRIIFNAFKKNEINATAESVNAAIEKLQFNAFNNIKLLKKQEDNVYKGRRLGNEMQLYINSKLYLDSQQ